MTWQCNKYPCYASGEDYKEKCPECGSTENFESYNARKTLEALLALPKAKSDGGWAPVSNELWEALHAHFDAVMREAIRPDINNDISVEYNLTDRTKGRAVCSWLTVPYNCDTPMERYEYTRAVGTLGSCIDQLMKQLNHKMYDDIKREESKNDTNA